MENEPDFEEANDSQQEAARWEKYKSELPPREPWEIGKPITYTYDQEGDLLSVVRPERPSDQG